MLARLFAVSGEASPGDAQLPDRRFCGSTRLDYRSDSSETSSGAGASARPRSAGGQPGDVVTTASRRGEVTMYARADDSSPRGAVFVPFCFYEAAINRLTNAALDPFAKIPEFKYCAIRVTLGGEAPVQASYGGGQALENLENSLA